MYKYILYWNNKDYVWFKSIQLTLLCLQDAVQEFFRKVGIGFVSGTLASCVNIPFDVAKSRIQGPQPVPGEIKYRTTLGSMAIVYREEGQVSYSVFLFSESTVCWWSCCMVCTVMIVNISTLATLPFLYSCLFNSHYPCYMAVECSKIPRRCKRRVHLSMFISLIFYQNKNICTAHELSSYRQVPECVDARR